MTLVRSFLDYGSTDKPKTIRAGFEDYAATVLFSKKLFWEAGSFPSIQKIFNAISRKDDSASLIHPLTGKPIGFVHKVEPEPQVPVEPAF